MDKQKKISVSSDRNMNPNSLNNLTPFKAGVSGNPSGKPSNRKLKLALNKVGDLKNPKPPQNLQEEILSRS